MQLAEDTFRSHASNARPPLCSTSVYQKNPLTMCNSNYSTKEPLLERVHYELRLKNVNEDDICGMRGYL
uniref:Uncharacterized protein n=1 Tax=Panagrellus redivivus TaxID=6233 RepID=A0A7E4VES6_PANRE